MSMVTSPTLADFEAVNWLDCIRAASEKSCTSYSTLFRFEAEKQQANGSSVGAGIFTRLAAWTSVRLHTEDASAFPASFLDAVSEGDFLLLRDLAPVTTDDELKARLADIAWQGRIQNRRDPDMARLAVEAYLRSSGNFASQWWEQSWRIERALHVAFSLGHGALEIESVWMHIGTTIAAINGDDDWFLSERLMQLLLEAKRDDEKIYAPMAERAARKATSQKGVGQRDKERRYWELKAQWHSKESEERCEALQFAAETYVAEASDEMAGFYGAPNPIGAAKHLQSAVESYRAIDNPARFQSRVEELHRLMIEVNREAQKTFESHSQTVDLSSFITQATNQVKGLSFHEALQALLLLYTSPSKMTLRDQVEGANDEMVELLCSYEQVNAAGQVVARRPSLLSPDPKQREEAQIYEMFRIAAEQNALVARALFVPALYQMQKEHHVSLRDWAAVLRHSPFVPGDRVWLFARGFQAGWQPSTSWGRRP